MKWLPLLILICGLASPALAKTHAAGGAGGIPQIAPVTVTYDVYVGGVHLVQANVTFEEHAKTYRARVLGHSVGIWYRLFPWDTELKTHGAIRGDHFVPAEFYTHDVWGRKAKSTWLHFKKNGDIDPKFDPPENSANHREPVSFDQRHGSLDPVTGLLQLLAHEAVHQNCNVSVPIYEGRRRFDIISSDEGYDDIDDEDYNVFHGHARLCNAAFTMVAGEWIDRPPDRFWTRDANEKGREPFHIWLGKIDEHLPDMPVRLESGSIWGIIVMHMSAWHYATPDELKF